MPHEAAFNAACKNCRLAKVKCIRIDNDADAYKGEKCRRCRGAGWECSLMPRAARKRRKKTDARVEVLEGQIKEMEVLMGRAKGRGGSRVEKLGEKSAMRWAVNEGTMKDVPTMMLPLTPESGGMGEVSTGMSLGSSTVTRRSSAPAMEEMPMEMLIEETTILPGIVPDILEISHAQGLITKFITSTVAQFPLILLPPTTTFSQLATTRPTLLLAMLTAASMSSQGALFKQLHDELTRRLAMKVIVGGERSLELVQALLVMEVWYCFPDDLDEGVNFYQWIHIAATMALQLGLGRCSWVEGKDLERAMEEARILLAVYNSCSSAAVSLRRENVMKLTPCLQDCLQKFEQHATSIQDKCLLARVKLQMISEEAQSITPKQEHVRGSFLSKSSDVEFQVYCFLQQLEKWECGMKEGVMNENLLIHYLYCKAKVLEIPLHAYHDLSRLIAYPFLYDNDSNDRPNPSIMAPVYMRASMPFLEANHKLLDTFASFPSETLANFPTVPFVRVIYAMNALQLLIRGPLFNGDVEAKRRIEDVKARVGGVLVAAVGDGMKRVPLAVLGVWTRMGGKEPHRRSLSDSVRDEDERTVPEQALWDQPNASWTSPKDSNVAFLPPDPSPVMVDTRSANSFSTRQDYSYNHLTPANMDARMMETFLNGFGAADLIT